MKTNDLVIRSLGATTSTEATIDVLKAESAGAETKAEFISSCFQQGTDSFQPVQRLKLKKFETMEKTAKVTSSQNRAVH